MNPLDSPIWKERDSAGSDADEILRDLMEGKGDFRENMGSLGEDLSCQICYYDATAYVLPHLAVLCTKLSLEDKAFLITEIGPDIAALLGNNPRRRQSFALSALAILGEWMHAYGMVLMIDSDWKACIGACSCSWKEEVISFYTDKDYFCMEPVRRYF